MRIFNNHVVANFPQARQAKEFFKSVNIRRRYGQKFGSSRHVFMVGALTILSRLSSRVHIDYDGRQTDERCGLGLTA